MKTETILTFSNLINKISRRRFLAATGLLAAALLSPEAAPETEAAPGVDLPGLGRLAEAITALTDFAANPKRDASGAVDIIALLDLDGALVQAVEAMDNTLCSEEWETALGRITGRDPLEMLPKYE